MATASLDTTTTHVEAPAFAFIEAPQEPAPSCWDGFKAVLKTGCELICNVALYVIAGLASLLIWPSLAGAFFGYASAILLTRIVVKILDRYNLACLQTLKASGNDFIKQYPRFELIALLVAVVISALSGWMGAISAIPTGLLSGLMMDMRRNEAEIKVKLRRSDAPDVLPI